MSSDPYDDILPSVLTGAKKEGPAGEQKKVPGDEVSVSGVNRPAAGVSVHSETQSASERDAQSGQTPGPGAQPGEPERPPSPLFGCPAGEAGARSWGVLGRVSGQQVRIDLQYPKLTAIFGQIGSGKSYLAGVLTEMAALRMPGLNHFAASESAVVIFNFRRSREARFEYATYLLPNSAEAECQTLREQYGLAPAALPANAVQVCAYRGEIGLRAASEYQHMRSIPLLFRAEDLEDDDWMLLMGHPNPSQTLYLEVLRGLLRELAYSGSGHLTLDEVRRAVDTCHDLDAGQKKMAGIRLRLASEYIASDGIRWGDVVRPGTATVVDLRSRLGRADDALRLSIIVLRALRGLPPEMPKFVLFDEFHEYYDEGFSDSLGESCRMARHYNINVCLASQNTHKVDKNLLRQFSNKFVFQVDNATWEDLVKAEPLLGLKEYSEVAALRREAGECFALFDSCTDTRFERRPVKLNVRPRITSHGGTTR
jgi:hypothetical protein